MTLRVLDLFSGIGGFSLGLERAGMRTVAFCEIEPYPRRVLVKHWPGVPCYDDVRTLTAERLAADGIVVDLICGGFPCQDLSVAGKQAGMDGERSGLWSEIARLVGELRPRYVVVENVSALLGGDDGRWFGRVLGDLAALGYDAEWTCVCASDVGAPHQRERVWIIAYPASVGQPQPGHHWAHADFGPPDGGWKTTDAVDALRRGAVPVMCREHARLPRGMDRLAALGNAVVPQIPEIIGRAILEAEGLTPRLRSARGGVG